MVEEAKPALTFEVLNPTGLRTLLLPEMFSSHHEFHLLLSTPHLQEYHLLLPDLPRHGLSADLNVSFTLPSMAALLADLVATHAKNGKADIFGGDLGGYAALYLATKYPALISSIIVTGCERDYGSIFYSTWIAIKTYLGAVLGLILVPRSWLNALLKKLDSELNDELFSDMRKTLSWNYSYEVFKMLHHDWGTGKAICEKVAARTLFIAAGRQDIIEGARERGAWLRKGQADRERRSKAVVVHGARHALLLQLGIIELLAKGIKAWIENEELPDQYEVLEGVD
jgi:pimeloyl-ACP methyl ester carboxylesterase